MRSIERELFTKEEEKKGIFGKGTFGRKLLLTIALLTAGIVLGVAAGRELKTLAVAA